MNFPSEPLPPSEESSSSTSSMPPPSVMELLSLQQPIPMAVMNSDPAHATAPTSISAKKSSKSAKKRKSGGEAATAPTTALPHAAPEPTVRHKSVREAVLNLLNFKAELFGDVDFAERALLNLARKVSSDRPSSGMADWVTAVSCRDPTTPCVPVSRPKDGRSVVDYKTLIIQSRKIPRFRMTVAKSVAGGGGTKKVFPQIIICQIFRW